jgi:16S rRNA (guanine527-N7)-methyltransferase
MTILELGEIAAANGSPLSNEQLEKLSMYTELLRAKNQVVNLISRKDEDNILSKHVLHSLCLIFPRVSPAGIPLNANIFDLGTGGGLPGIPIAIARPDISMTLCDSIAKKIIAVTEIIQKLGLESAHAVAARAEALAVQILHKRKYDVVMTRAVAPLEDLAIWSSGLLKKGGMLVSLKGGDLMNEKKKTENLKFVKSVEEASLSLEGFDEFLKEEKKIVRVTMV